MNAIERLGLTDERRGLHFQLLKVGSFWWSLAHVSVRRILMVSFLLGIGQDVMAFQAIPNPCPTESHECTEAQARGAAEAAVAHYQQNFPSLEAKLAHQPAQSGREFGAYGVRTIQSGTAWVYSTFYRARRFSPWPDNPCGSWSARTNCTEADAFAIVKLMERYFIERESPYGAYVLPSPSASVWCLMWTNPAGCQYLVYYYQPELDETKCSECAP